MNGRVFDIRECGRRDQGRMDVESKIAEKDLSNEAHRSGDLREMRAGIRKKGRSQFST